MPLIFTERESDISPTDEQRSTQSSSEVVLGSQALEITTPGISIFWLEAAASVIISSISDTRNSIQPNLRFSFHKKGIYPKQIRAQIIQQFKS